MSKYFNFPKHLVFIIAFFSATVLYAADKADTYFSAGIEAFNNSDYVTAKSNFEMSEKEGMSRAALYYNLGVTYYKLGQYKKSQGAFIKTAQYKQMESLAHYNLGLVAKQLNDEEKAEQWFGRAYNGNDKKIRALAAKQLGKKGWKIISVNVGYDDNLIDPAVGTGSTKSNVYTDLFVAIGGPANWLASNGLQFDVSAYLSRYQSLDIYDYNMFHVGLAQPFVTSNWINKAGLKLEHSTLGGESYQRTMIFDIRTKHASGNVTNYKLRYKLRLIDSLNSAYDYLQGAQHRMSVAVQWKHSGDTGLRYTIEINNRDDFTGTGVFTSYSPTRQSLELSHETPVEGGFNWRTKFGYRVSEYPDANVFMSGASIFRSDDRMQFKLSFIKQLNTDWQVVAEYQYTNNDSNISVFSYRRNIYTIGVQGLF